MQKNVIGTLIHWYNISPIHFINVLTTSINVHPYQFLNSAAIGDFRLGVFMVMTLIMNKSSGCLIYKKIQHRDTKSCLAWGLRNEMKTMQINIILGLFLNIINFKLQSKYKA